MANSPSGDSVTDRIVRVLETFTVDRTVQTASEIGRRAGLPSSTAHRIVDDLVGAGLLDRDDEHRLSLGMHLWELALRGSRALRLRQAALPHMERVQARVREHTQLAVLEQDSALFLERLSHMDGPTRPEAPGAATVASGEGVGTVSNITRIAGRLPLHASSSGLVLLAHADAAVQERVLSGRLVAVSAETMTDATALRRRLAEIRRAGFVVAPGSIERVATGVAVPVRDAGGDVIAALSVVLPRETPPDVAIVELLRAARAIRADLGSPFNGKQEGIGDGRRTH